MKVVSLAELEGFAARLLEAGGYATRHAAETAALLVWANLRGVESHGVLRIPRYLDAVQAGAIDPCAIPKRVRVRGATAVIDAKRAPGAVGMNMAVPQAVALARDHGIGWCAVRRITHAGAVGYFAEQVADAGLVGIVMTASKPLMTYFGAKSEAVSTNPIAIAAPRGSGLSPLLLDMSTSAVSLGKVLAARDAGTSIPVGWGVDSDGNDVTDPAAVASLLPMAGAKGSGLSLMVELLCSVLVATPIIAPALAGEPVGLNGFVLAVEPAAFSDEGGFEAQAHDLSLAIQTLSPAAGVDRVRLPGERGYETAQARRAEGIPLAIGTAARLSELAAASGVATPEVLQD